MKIKILMVLCVLIGLGMVIFGANKLIPFIPIPTDEMTEDAKATFAAFMTIKWLMPLVGIAEIFGGILIAIPKTRALGAIVLLPIVVGIILHHAVYEPAGLGVPAIFAIVNFWAIIDSKDKYMPMIQ